MNITYPSSLSATEWNCLQQLLLAGLKYFVPRLKIIWADQAYQGQNLANWCTSTGDWTLEVVMIRLRVARLAR
jgi:transposase